MLRQAGLRGNKWPKTASTQVTVTRRKAYIPPDSAMSPSVLFWDRMGGLLKGNCNPRNQPPRVEKGWLIAEIGVSRMAFIARGPRQQDRKTRGGS